MIHGAYSRFGWMVRKIQLRGILNRQDRLLGLHPLHGTSLARLTNRLRGELGRVPKSIRPFGPRPIPTGLGNVSSGLGRQIFDQSNRAFIQSCIFQIGLFEFFSCPRFPSHFVLFTGIGIPGLTRSVLVRYKLVFKPLNSFNRPDSTPSFIGYSLFLLKFACKVSFGIIYS